jgi:hypothetical protein
VCTGVCHLDLFRLGRRPPAAEEPVCLRPFWGDVGTGTVSHGLIREAFPHRFRRHDSTRVVQENRASSPVRIDNQEICDRGPLPLYVDGITLVEHVPVSRRILDGLGDLNPACQARRLHAAGHIHRVTP